MAINLAMVAAGQADAYLHCGIHCWDIVAGALIVSEAGGAVADPSRKEFDFMSRRLGKQIKFCSLTLSPKYFFPAPPPTVLESW